MRRNMLQLRVALILRRDIARNFESGQTVKRRGEDPKATDLISAKTEAVTSEIELNPEGSIRPGSSMKTIPPNRRAFSFRRALLAFSVKHLACDLIRACERTNERIRSEYVPVDRFLPRFCRTGEKKRER